MPIGFAPEHQEFGQSVAGFAARHASIESTRRALAELGAGALPECWEGLVGQGLTAVHLPEEHGGAGAGVLELAVALEEAGRALLPGPFLPSVLTSTVIARYAGEEAAKALLPRLAEGAVAATALSAGLTARQTEVGWEVSGEISPVPGAAGAEFLLLGAKADTPGGEVWFVVRPGDGDAVTARAVDGVDLARDVARVSVRDLEVTGSQVLAGVTGERVRRLGAVLCAAEAVGVARWCFETALEYVKIREQFDRPVGSFQAIKHKAANLFTRLQVATAAAWDAARAADDTGADAEEQLELAAAEAAVICLPVAREMALDCITMLGGIGFTWEHDIHFYWRRGVFLAQILGEPGEWAKQLGHRALKITGGGAARRFDLELSADVDEFRAKVAADLVRAGELGEPERRHFLAECGYVSPHYPRPYGIAASPAQQIVIQQEFAKAGIVQPSTIIGEFALPTIMAHGTQEQKDKFVPATLRGDIVWCQLFSEPGAGSDLASLKTRAEKVEGGWKLNGQKVWNSKAHEAHFGICLARTDASVPKHKGITYFIVDMSDPGLDVRPLKQANGQAEFNEVFINDVFVPDHMVVGEINQGWVLARTTLANERVMIAGGPGMAAFGQLLDEIGPEGAAVTGEATVAKVGTFAAENWALRALTLRSTLQQLSGLNPGAASSVLKLAVTEHQRAVQTARLERAGAAGVTTEGLAGELVTAYLSIPAVLLGGGTREIQLNVVAERILGLPRG